MNADDKLVRALRGMSDERRTESNITLKEIDDYEVACSLSTGPDPGRAAHWGEKAKAAENRLLYKSKLSKSTKRL